MVETSVLQLGAIEAGTRVTGPALIESPVTTLVVDPETEAVKTRHGSILMNVVSR